MEWNIVYDSSKGSSVQQVETYYNNTTLLKNRFIESGDGVRLTANLHQLYWKVGLSTGAGLSDNLPNKEFVDRNTTFYGAEIEGINNEIYAFKDINNHYLVNVYAPFGEGHEIWIHSGVAADGTEVCKINTDIANNVADTLTLTTAFNTLNNSYGNDYILQPLCVLNEKTPFYMICGNAQLEVFSNIIVNNKKFMIVGKGVCVEIE